MISRGGPVAFPTAWSRTHGYVARLIGAATARDQLAMDPSLLNEFEGCTSTLRPLLRSTQGIQWEHGAPPMLPIR